MFFVVCSILTSHHHHCDDERRTHDSQVEIIHHKFKNQVVQGNRMVLELHVHLKFQQQKMNTTLFTTVMNLEAETSHDVGGTKTNMYCFSQHLSINVG